MCFELPLQQGACLWLRGLRHDPVHLSMRNCDYRPDHKSTPLRSLQWPTPSPVQPRVVPLENTLYSSSTAAPNTKAQFSKTHPCAWTLEGAVLAMQVRKGTFVALVLASVLLDSRGGSNNWAEGHLLSHGLEVCSFQGLRGVVWEEGVTQLVGLGTGCRCLPSTMLTHADKTCVDVRCTRCGSVGPVGLCVRAPMHARMRAYVRARVCGCVRMEACAWRRVYVALCQLV